MYREIFIWNHTFDFKSKWLRDFEFTRIYIIIYLQNFQNAHWARACQFTPNISESRNWVKKVNIGWRKMNLKWLRVSRDSTTKQNGRKVRRKWTLFQFRGWGRILKEKTPNKVKATRLKSGFQKRISNYEPEVLNKIPEKFYATVHTKDGEDYERNSFLGMFTVIDRYLSEKN